MYDANTTILNSQDVPFMTKVQCDVGLKISAGTCVSWSVTGIQTNCVITKSGTDFAPFLLAWGHFTEGHFSTNMERRNNNSDRRLLTHFSI